MASGSPFLLGPLPPPPAPPPPTAPGYRCQRLNFAHCPGRHRPRPSFLTWGWPTPSRPCEGESELPRGPTGWQGPKLQPSGEPCGCRDLCQGRGRRGRARGSPAVSGFPGPLKSERGSRGCLDSRGHAAPMPCSAQTGRRRRVGGRIAQGRVSGARPSLRPPNGAAQGDPGRGTPNDRPGGTRAPSPSSARASPGLTGLVEAGSLRRRSARGSARPSSGRQLHAAASSARPAPAPLWPLPHTFHRK